MNADRVNSQNGNCQFCEHKNRPIELISPDIITKKQKYSQSNRALPGNKPAPDGGLIWNKETGKKSSIAIGLRASLIWNISK